VQLTEERYEELSTMDDDAYDRRYAAGTITPEENAACVQRMRENLAHLERQVARMRQEAADRAEVHQRLIAEIRDQTVEAKFDSWRLEDDARHAKAVSKELLIDYGVEAAKRGEDPIEAMRERRNEVAFCAELVMQGYMTVDIEGGSVVATHMTAKGRRLMARIRAQK